MVKQEVDVKVVGVDLDTFLPSKEGEAAAEL
jgi:hypothetical protein